MAYSLVDYESPFLALGDFHARSRFARSTTIPEEKSGTTRSLIHSMKVLFFSGSVLEYLKMKNSYFV